MKRPTIFMFPFILLALGSLIPSSECSNENQILTLIQKMESAFKTMEDYTCEVEQIFYRNGVEDQRYQFKFYFGRNKRRVDFSHPYPTLTLLYTDGTKGVTVLPFRSLPLIKFRFPVDNPTVRTIAGQRIDQTDIGYFIKFLLKNLKGVKQGETEFNEDGDQIRFTLWAMDYIAEKERERYRIFVSKKDGFPVRIERYTLEGSPIEITNIKNYVLNSHLEDRFFTP